MGTNYFGYKYFSDDNPGVVASFTGYRPHKLPGGGDENNLEMATLRAVLKKEIALLADSGILWFQSGMARGVDLICAELVLELQREKYPDIKLLAAVPCRDYNASWSDSEKKRAAAVTDSAVVCYISGENYSNGCMQKRNRWLVETASTLLAVYDGQGGGTHYTIEYAKKCGRHIIIIDPFKMVKIELFDEKNKEFLQQTLY